VINDSTINKLDEAINEVDHVTYETSIQEKGIKSFKALCFIHLYIQLYVQFLFILFL